MTHTFPSLLVNTAVPGREFGIHAESTPGSEAFVMLTLGFLAFLFIGFAIAGYVLWRRENRPEPHRRLLMEMENEAASEQMPARDKNNREPDAKPWERDPDWWKE